MNQASVSVRIKILDVNDNPPIFDQTLGETSWPENAKLGLDGPVKRFRVVDNDTGKNGEVKFEVVGDDAKFFGVDSETKAELPDKTTSYAVLYPKIPLDYESKTEHRIRIRAKNIVEYTSVDESILEPELELVIKIENVNEPPQFAKKLFIFEGKL